MEDSGHVRGRVSAGFARWSGAIALMVICGFAASAAASDGLPRLSVFPAIHGEVVDDATLAALPGVAILAFWAGPYASPLDYSDTLRVIEVTTGAEGSFLVPESEPLAVPVAVGGSSPNVLCFKAGYQPVWLNRISTVLVGQPVTIRLEKWNKPAAEQSEVFAAWAANLAWLAASQDGKPQGLFVTIEAEWTRLQAELPPSERARTSLRTRFDWLVEEFRRANRERGTKR